LFKHGRYPTANAISIIALEEMGKYMILSHGLFYNFFASGSDEIFINKILNETYDHRLKQRIFVNNDWHESYYNDVKRLKAKNIDYSKVLDEKGMDFERIIRDKAWSKHFPNMKKLYEKINTLEKDKHKSSYVGFSKKGGNVDLSKRLSSPFNFSQKKVENQITYLDSCILM
jgi:AbiV family abortive infection protein